VGKTKTFLWLHCSPLWDPSATLWHRHFPEEPFPSRHGIIEIPYFPTFIFKPVGQYWDTVSGRNEMYYGCRPGKKTFSRESCRWIFPPSEIHGRRQPSKIPESPVVEVIALTVIWQLYYVTRRSASLADGWLPPFALPNAPFPDCNIRQYEKTDLNTWRESC